MRRTRVSTMVALLTLSILSSRAAAFSLVPPPTTTTTRHRSAETTTTTELFAARAAVEVSARPVVAVAAPSRARAALAVVATGWSAARRWASVARGWPWRRIAAAALAWSLANEAALAVRVRRRQAVDPTSEWGRYADRPAARGRALGLLLTRVAPSLLFRNRATSEARQRSGDRLAEGLLRLGPLYVKLGQILSCREELLPDEWVVSLARLQDRVPAKSGPAAVDLCAKAFGSKGKMDEVLSEFDDRPLAAASLGQVHRARLRSNGAEVAVKVQRDRLRDIYDNDLSLLRTIAEAADKITALVDKNNKSGARSYADIYADAETILYREIDYRDEARNARRFADDFGLGANGTATDTTPTPFEGGDPLPSANDWLRTPYTYVDLCTEKILVMEYLPSVKINDHATLSRRNVTLADRERLAESLARAYLRQFCVNRFFSTDPHPGNVGVAINDDDDDDPPRLVLYDFGQACSLRPDQAEGILEVVEGILDSDAEGCVRAFDKMGVLVDGADKDVVERKVRQNFETGKIKVRKKRVRRTDGDVVPPPPPPPAPTKNTTSTEEVQDKDVMPYFTLPAEYAFVARALSQMDGVGKGLDPEFDFISAAAPHIVEIKGGAKFYLEDRFQKVRRDAEREFNTWRDRLFTFLGIA